jgi:hypothetical protein
VVGHISQGVFVLWLNLILGSFSGQVVQINATQLLSGSLLASMESSLRLMYSTKIGQFEVTTAEAHKYKVTFSFSFHSLPLWSLPVFLTFHSVLYLVN